MSDFGLPSIDEIEAKRVTSLLEALHHPADAQVRQAAAQALGETGDKRAVEGLLSVLQDKELLVREAAALALGNIGDIRAIEPLIAALQDSEADMRAAAVAGLVNLGDAQAVEPLIAILQDNDKTVRRTVALGLGLLGDARAVAPLRVLLKDSEEYVRGGAEGGLALLGHFSVDEDEEPLAIERPLETAIKMLSFERWDAIGEHIAREINTISPERVLIIGGDSRWSKSLVEQLRQKTDKYEVLLNQACSLRWLCDTVNSIRVEQKRAILLSNFPRETDPPTTHYLENGVILRTVTMPKGTSLSLCDPHDQTTTVFVFLIGAYAMGYCDSVYRSQATGREDKTQFQVLVHSSGRALLGSEIGQLKACSSEIERQRMLWEIAQKLEQDPNPPPVAYSGGILFA